MKKIFLFIVAALFATSVKAVKWTEIDSVPAPRYFLDIQYDPVENVISFMDTFRIGETLDRWYMFEAFDPQGNKLYTDGSTYKYGYTIDFDTECVEKRIAAGRFNYKSSGGYVNSKGKFWRHEFEQMMDLLIRKGYDKVHIIIRGEYQNGNTTVTFNSGNKDYYVNSFDLELPAVAFCKVSAPETVKYGENYTVTASFKIANSGDYWLQESDAINPTEKDWHTILSGRKHAKEDGGPLYEVSKTIAFDQTGVGPYRHYRLIASGLNRGGDFERDTSASVKVIMLYPITVFNKAKKDWHSVGDTYTLVRPEDCMEYNINSLIPISAMKEYSSYMQFVMPASPVAVTQYQPSYKVNFYNADGTLLKETVVPCGEEAPAPDPGTFVYHGYLFKEWSRDITNVHKNMNVYARYEIEGAYTLDLNIVDHKNSKYDAEYYGFAGSDTRAMIGDSITFEATMFAPAEATLRYEYANYKDAEGNWLWSAPTNNLLGTLTQAEIDDFNGEPKVIRHTQAVAYDYYNEMYRSPGFAFRVDMATMGQHFYSDPIELDVYYPITLNSQIPLAEELVEYISAQNTCGDFADGASPMLPVKYNDTVFIARQKGAATCMSLKRDDNNAAISTEEDTEGRTYFIASDGEPMTINIDVKRVAVIFDGTSLHQQIDLGTYGKFNGWHGEVVNCGGAVKQLEDPVEDGYIFTGWKSWNDTEYPDDAYLNVPANVTGPIGFTAQFDEIPNVTYTVRFFQTDADGTNPQQLETDQSVKEGESAYAPDYSSFFYIPDGYHFNGWDKAFDCVMSDLDIYVLWASNTDIWTVTYYDSDGTTVLGSENVNDGEALIGITPVKEDFAFDHWVDNTTGDPVDIMHVHGNWNLKAVYKPIASLTFVVRYMVGNTVYHSVEVPVNTAVITTRPATDPTKEPTAAEVFTFTGWTPDNIETVTTDLLFTATFSADPRTYEVIFQNWDHTLLKNETVNYGSAATAPADPTREGGYTFKGWDREFSQVKTDMVVTALFEKAKEGEQGLEDICIDGDTAQKVLVDGALYIVLPDGKVYNANGLRVR